MMNVDTERKRVVTFTSFVRFLFLAIFFLADSSATADESDDVALSVPELAEKIRRSLVSVKVVGRDGKEASFASGFVISKDGLIATAFHSVAEGYGIAIEDSDGNELQVTHVHARLPAADLVVLKVDADKLAPLTLASTTPPDGAAVVAMGHPQGLRNSVATGIVSRREEIDGIQMLQLSMPVERGSSGEPVVNTLGRVVGIVTLKSSIQDATGYAVPVQHLQRMLEDPAPMPIESWQTIGRLDETLWTTMWAANWRRQGTSISVDGYGESFGGRSLCLWKSDVPTPKFEIQVDVKLDNEDGAAGLVFHSDSGDRHYGFYPSAGRLRVTRFGGPTVNSWTILRNDPQSGYEVGSWNTLKVSGNTGQYVFFLNGKQIYSLTDDRLAAGKSGLAVFRGTNAHFRRFQVADSLPDVLPDDDVSREINEILAAVGGDRPAGGESVNKLRPHSRYSARVMEQYAKDLEQRAAQIRRLAIDVHADATQQALISVLKPEATATALHQVGKAGLLRAALLVARLDNPDVDVDAYVSKVDAMAAKISSSFDSEDDRSTRLEALDEMLFRQMGYRGSRFEYYSQENSYLNQVIDDREGLPVALCVLYLELGRRLKIPMQGLGLPGHFIVRSAGDSNDDEDIYIDVFNQGARMSKDDVDRLIVSRSKPSPAYFEAQTQNQIIDRMLRNLLGLAEERRDEDAIFRYVETLAALDESNPEYRARRMMIRAQTLRFEGAIADVNWFINNKGFGADLDQFYELRADFERQLELRNPQPNQ